MWGLSELRGYCHQANEGNEGGEEILLHEVHEREYSKRLAGSQIVFLRGFAGVSVSKVLTVVEVQACEPGLPTN